MDSKEYKKAYKHYLKTKSEPSNEITAFRAQEKRFKSRFPPPELSDVLDLWAIDPNLTDELKHLFPRIAGGLGDDDTLFHFPLSSEGADTHRAYCLRSHPGMAEPLVSDHG
jgi:alkylated DNA repair protein alkB family protein 1